MALYNGEPPAANFAMVPNHWFRDPRLSGKAKGYMGYIATHAPGYKLTIKQMIAEMAEGKDAIYAGLAELVKYGYLLRVQQRGEDNQFGEVDYHFGPAAYAQQYERAWGARGDVSAGEAASGFSGCGFPGRGEPAPKKTTSKKTIEEDSVVEWPSKAGRDDGDPNLPTMTEETPNNERPAFSDWRAEDRDLFRSIVGDKVISDGSVWTEGTFPADVWYESLRTKAKPIIKWPGLLMQHLVDTHGLDNWLFGKGLELDYDETRAA